MKPCCMVADQIHLISMLLILYKLYACKGCKGLSPKSQVLFAIVYTTRYLDLFTDCISFYIRVMKVLYLLIKYTTVYLMYVEYKDKLCECEDNFRMLFLIVPAAILALLINYCCSPMEMIWTFSVYLESVAVLPQFILLNNTGCADTLMSTSLFLLGTYKLLYVTYWILRNECEEYDLILIIPGILQTALCYLTFGVTMF